MVCLYLQPVHCAHVMPMITNKLEEMLTGERFKPLQSCKAAESQW